MEHSGWTGKKSPGKSFGPHDAEIEFVLYRRRPGSVYNSPYTTGAKIVVHARNHTNNALLSRNDVSDKS